MEKVQWLKNLIKSFLTAVIVLVISAMSSKPIKLEAYLIVGVVIVVMLPSYFSNCFIDAVYKDDKKVLK